MTDRERKLLVLVKSRQGTGNPIQPVLPLSGIIRSLIARGYLKMSRAVCPIVGVLDGEMCLSVTEAGMEVVRA